MKPTCCSPVACSPFVSRGAAAGLPSMSAWRKGIPARSAPGASNEFAFNRRFLPAGWRARCASGNWGQEINFDGRIEQPVRPAAGGERQADFFISITTIRLRPGCCQGWEGPQTHTEVKRGYGIFVSAQNPALATSLRCASTIGALDAAGRSPPTSPCPQAPAGDRGKWRLVLRQPGPCSTA